jgi:hypothetical protein
MISVVLSGFFSEALWPKENSKDFEKQTTKSNYIVMQQKKAGKKTLKSSSKHLV